MVLHMTQNVPNSVSVTGRDVTRVLREACRIRVKARQLPLGNARCKLENSADELESIVQQICGEQDSSMNRHALSGIRQPH